MGLLNKLGLKKNAEPEQPSQERETEKKVEARAEHKPVSSRGSATAHQILIHPVLSEKGTHLAGKGEYVFLVAPGANKTEIGKAVGKVYGVHVRAVKIIKAPGKQRRYGRSLGRTSPRKKALVQLRAGEKIAGIIEAVG